MIMDVRKSARNNFCGNYDPAHGNMVTLALPLEPNKGCDNSATLAASNKMKDDNYDDFNLQDLTRMI